MPSRPKLEFAKSLNPQLGKYCVYIYSAGRVLTQNAFLRAIKFMEPKKEKFSWDAETRNGYFRYAIKTKFGNCEYSLVNDKILIDAWDNQPLIEKIVEAMAAHPEFEKVEPREKPEVIQEKVPEPVDFRFSSRDDSGLIYMDIEEPFSEDVFLKIIGEMPDLAVTNRETIFSSFGPLESCREITTSHGKLTINSVWEGQATGYTISGDLTFIKAIVSQLEKSGYFFLT